MDSLDLKNKLQSAGYELTELGDGTAALISLDKGKIVTLNRVATIVVASLFDDQFESMDIQNFIDHQSESISDLFSESTGVVMDDVSKFVSDLINAVE